jgi:hypothetical protein
MTSLPASTFPVITLSTLAFPELARSVMTKAAHVSPPGPPPDPSPTQPPGIAAPIWQGKGINGTLKYVVLFEEPTEKDRADCQGAGLTLYSLSDLTKVLYRSRASLIQGPS